MLSLRLFRAIFSSSGYYKIYEEKEIIVSGKFYFLIRLQLK